MADEVAYAETTVAGPVFGGTGPASALGTTRAGPVRWDHPGRPGGPGTGRRAQNPEGWRPEPGHPA
ncbi:hypothetical protein, partial [Micromonospora sp. NPDC049662]|uniref:hypothetical protein n=1 Tax=Micromonospora sp. NPDC049662 TaxID=3155397 RepID=UPI00344349E8